MVKKSKVSALVLAMLLGSVSGMASAASGDAGAGPSGGGPSGGPGGSSAGNIRAVIPGFQPSDAISQAGTFRSDMTQAQLRAVIKGKLTARKTLADIVDEARKAGVDAADLTTALIAERQFAVAVVTAVVNAYPTQKESIRTAAISAAPTLAEAISAVIDGATASGQDSSSKPQLPPTPNELVGGGASPS